MDKLDSNAALVLFSGGQDSTTCLAWALSRFEKVETIGFKYGQRHAVELDVREPIRRALSEIRTDWGQRLRGDQLLDLDILHSLSDSALTSDLPLRARPDGLPNTFLPGRNLVFLTFAAIVAYHRGLKHLVGGMCETDYSGYPDCRDDTIKAIQTALNLGLQSRLVVHTPLMWINKARTWEMAEFLGGKPLVNLIVECTHTCYLGDRAQRHEWGYGCGTCDACLLRRKGWLQYQLTPVRDEPDPSIRHTRV